MLNYLFFTIISPIFALVILNFRLMIKYPIHVTLPASYVDECSSKGVNVTEALSVAYNNNAVDFIIDVVPDDYFSELAELFG